MANKHPWHVTSMISNSRRKVMHSLVSCRSQTPTNGAFCSLMQIKMGKKDKHKNEVVIKRVNKDKDLKKRDSGR